MSNLLPHCSAASFGRRLPDDSSWVIRLLKSGATLLAWSCAAMLGFGIFGVVAAVGNPPLASVLGPAGFLFFMACLTHLIRTLRRRRAATILAYVEQAIRLNLPLSRYLGAAQQSETGKTACRLRDVRELLDAGAPLEIALETQVPEMPRRSLSLIGAAQRIGRLPDMLRVLAAQERERRRSASSNVSIAFIYVLVMVLSISSFLGFYVVFLLPKIEYILMEFGVQPPAILVWMIGVARVVPFLTLPLGGAAIVLYPAMRLWEIFRPVSCARVHRGWMDRVISWTPVVRGMARDRGLADVCRVVGESLRVGFPLDRALFEASELHIQLALKRRVESWFKYAQEGVPASDGARRAGLPPLVVGMLGTAHASGSMAEAMEFLARYYEVRYSRSALLLQGALAPVVSLVMGAMVCGMALSLFLPMMRLIEQVGLQWHRF